MTTRIKLRRDTAANWTTENPILAVGEPGLESDTGKVKYGDGVSRWNVLEHANSDALVNEGAITVQTGDDDRWFVRLRREDQTYDPQWAGVVVTSTNYDSLGNAIVAAKIELQNDGIVIAKFNPSGELVWKKSVGAVNGDRYLESNLVIDSDDNIVFAINLDSGNVKSIVKINGETGAVIFSEVLLLNDSFNIKAIAVDSGNNIIIGGYFYFNPSDEDVGFVAKLNPTADTIIWQRSLMVDSGWSEVNCVAVDYMNNIIVGGFAQVEHTVDGNTETTRTMLVAKITNIGGIGWQKSISLDDINQGQVSGISLDNLGNIYATGEYYVDSATSDVPWGGQKRNAIVVFKMTSQGAMVWDRRVGPGECAWVGVSTAVGEDGDLYLYASTYQYTRRGEVNSSLGYWNATLALARYNKATGALIWQSYFDNPNAQEIPGEGNDSPWNDAATDLMAVRGNKILIGGAVRLGQSGVDQFDTPWDEYDYFNQGFLAQFDTDATPWSAEGWTLSTSRIPGKLTNTLVAVNGSISLNEGDVNIDTDGSMMLSSLAVGLSVRRTASKTNTWTFGKDGSFSAPVDANIKLNQRQLGYANMYGVFPNNFNDIWFESVCHDNDGFAYVLSSTTWGPNDRAYFYKFTPEGELVWKRQLFSGSGADFYVEWSGGVYTLVEVDNGGEGYKVGDRIILRGSDFSGQDGINSLTLEVATITNDTDNVGSIDTVNIVGGVSVGSSDANASDPYDNAQCEIRSMTFDPVTGNLMIVITTPTYNGDTYDQEWTETVVLQIDSGSGTVVSTTTLQDEGDVYAYDVDVSSTGKVAVVGQKYNEYNEYGAITPLTGSGLDKFWVAKADIDAEHFPGESFSNVSDWWITGDGIVDQAIIFNVNNYQNLTTTVRQGSGATFTIADNGNGTYGVSAPTLAGTNYRVGHKIKVLGTAIGGATPANDCIVTVNEINSETGAITILGNVSGTAAGGAYQAYNDLSGTNYNVGSGVTLNIDFLPTTGAVDDWGVYNNGTNYVQNDVITIAGTSFAGGTAPANNITVTVNGVGIDGTIISFTPTGSIPSTHLLLSTDYGVDFSPGSNTFAIKQVLGGEAFIWTPDFNKAIGFGSNDWFSGVVWNAAGTSLYAVGTGRYEVTYQQALVVKYSSTGTLQHSKFVNDDMNECNADRGAVALMANDSIVVVHQQYNTYRDEQDEILVTKLDSSLNIIWQQFIGVDGGDGWESPDSPISVAVDPATDEILIAWEAQDYTDLFDDDAIHIVKLDTDGEVIWKRMFGVYESDSGMNYEDNGNKALSIHGDQFTLVGWTDAPDDDSDNGFIVTLPLDGTGVGLHGLWTYAEPTDDKIKVWRLSNRTSTTFTPTVHSGGITAVDNLKYYYTTYPNEDFTLYPQVIRSNEGGALEFSDGSKQTFSTAIVPQVKISAGRYTIRPEDSGRHILVEDTNYSIVIPSWKKVTLPVGFTITIINISDSTLTLDTENSDGSIWFSGGDNKTSSVDIDDNGSGQMVTLIKIKEGTYSDDAESHNDIWMIAGADIT